MLGGAKGAIYDLIELDNGDLVACANGNNFKTWISIYRYNDDEDRYELFKEIKMDDDISLLSSLVKLENNKFILATMENSIIFWAEKDKSYIKEKEVKLK